MNVKYIFFALGMVNSTIYFALNESIGWFWLIYGFLFGFVALFQKDDYQRVIDRIDLLENKLQSKTKRRS